MGIRDAVAFAQIRRYCNEEKQMIKIGYFCHILIPSFLIGRIIQINFRNAGKTLNIVSYFSMFQDPVPLEHCYSINVKQLHVHIIR